MTAAEYDLVVIGSGLAGQKGAIAAAKTRKRVALIGVRRPDRSVPNRRQRFHLRGRLRPTSHPPHNPVRIGVRWNDGSSGRALRQKEDGAKT